MTPVPNRLRFAFARRPITFLIETSFIPRSSELASFIPGGFTNTDRILLVDTKGNVSTSFNGLGPDVVRLVVAAIQSHRKSDRPH